MLLNIQKFLELFEVLTTPHYHYYYYYYYYYYLLLYNTTIKKYQACYGLGFRV